MSKNKLSALWKHNIVGVAIIYAGGHKTWHPQIGNV